MPLMELQKSLTSPEPLPAAKTHARRRSLPRGVRMVFSFPVFLAFALTALTALTVQGRFNDPDLWWHLRLGQVIWTNHAVPTTEIFSHTTFGHPWIPHEWLAQLSIFGAY